MQRYPWNFLWRVSASHYRAAGAPFILPLLEAPTQTVTESPRAPPPRVRSSAAPTMVAVDTRGGTSETDAACKMTHQRGSMSLGGGHWDHECVVHAARTTAAALLCRERNARNCVCVCACVSAMDASCCRDTETVRPSPSRQQQPAADTSSADNVMRQRNAHSRTASVRRCTRVGAGGYDCRALQQRALISTLQSQEREKTHRAHSVLVSARIGARFRSARPTSPAARPTRARRHAKVVSSAVSSLRRAGLRQDGRGREMFDVALNHNGERRSQRRKCRSVEGGSEVMKAG